MPVDVVTSPSRANLSAEYLQENTNFSQLLRNDYISIGQDSEQLFLNDAALAEGVNQNEIEINKLKTSFAQTSVNYTTAGSVFLRCLAELTVTLNPTPAERERAVIQVYGGNFNVTILGQINGQSQSVLFVDGDCVQLVYSSLFNEWVIN